MKIEMKIEIAWDCAGLGRLATGLRVTFPARALGGKVPCWRLTLGQGGGPQLVHGLTNTSKTRGLIAN